MRFAKCTQPRTLSRLIRWFGTGAFIAPLRSSMAQSLFALCFNRVPGLRDTRLEAPAGIGRSAQAGQIQGVASLAQLTREQVTQQWLGLDRAKLRRAWGEIWRARETLISHVAKAISIQVVDKLTAGCGVRIGRTTPCDAHPLHATPLDNGVDQLSRGSGYNPPCYVSGR
ncbi:hypothetical protein C8Q79DRAFT_376545 [Trametes meyenii]|nr:hypothetical protein C8Q79DRAFT_376545 [Trametes meyenii]